MHVNGGDIALLIGLAVVVAVIATIVVTVRAIPFHFRLIVLLGLLVVTAQVLYPPCLAPPKSDPRPTRRWAWDSNLSYGPSDSSMWVDTGRQTFGLLATAAATAIACGLLTWRRRRIQIAAPSSGEHPK
jgi:hypothetical protein